MGTAYEKMAGEYLKTQGYEILQYNFRCRMGEIDIIAKDHGYFVFIGKIPQRQKLRTSGGGSNTKKAAYDQQSCIVLSADPWMRDGYAVPF